MKVKAKISFTGTVNMASGEVREIKDEAVVNDLIQCGYVEKMPDEDGKSETVGKASDDVKNTKATKATNRRRSKKNED